MERIIADRLSKDGSGVVVPEYLVKWQGLSYAEATWYDKKTILEFFPLKKEYYFGVNDLFLVCWKYGLVTLVKVHMLHMDIRVIFFLPGKSLKRHLFAAILIVH